MWAGNGKPKSGWLLSNMRRSRMQFKYALRSCKANEQQHKADALAPELSTKDVKGILEKDK